VEREGESRRGVEALATHDARDAGRDGLARGDERRVDRRLGRPRLARLGCQGSRGQRSLRRDCIRGGEPR
jgi:hypothetical protein